MGILGVLALKSGAMLFPDDKRGDVLNLMWSGAICNCDLHPRCDAFSHCGMELAALENPASQTRLKRLHPYETFEIKHILLGLDFGWHPHRDPAIRDALRANRRATGHRNRRFAGRGGLLSRPNALVGVALDSSTIATALK
jgi:hypothetical protein